eukprot:1156245-Pelagomonas_calceolata.AAC.5
MGSTLPLHAEYGQALTKHQSRERRSFHAICQTEPAVGVHTPPTRAECELSLGKIFHAACTCALTWAA